MTLGQKTTLSILISVLLSGGVAVIAFTELFSVLDMRFYEPAKISSINKNLEAISKCYNEYIKTFDERFATGEAAYLKNLSIASFAESIASDEDIKKRTELTGILRSETQGLMGIRIVDRNKISVHYSTFKDDVLRESQQDNAIEYKNYDDLVTNSGNKELSLSEIAVEDNGGNSASNSLIYFDGTNGRIIFSYPFYDKYSVYRGTIVFYVNSGDFENLLVKRNLISAGADFDFLADKTTHGFAMGIPSVAHDDFIEPIFNVWKQGDTSIQKLFAINGGSSGDNSDVQNYWIVVSLLAGKDTFVSQVFNDEILVLPFSARMLILSCAFASIFLITFLIVNLRRDDMTVIRERILTLQLGVVDEYLKCKGELNANLISERREAVTKEIITSLGRRAKLHRKEVEELINRSWDELLAAMNVNPKAQQDVGFSEKTVEEIKNMLQEFFSSGSIKVQAVNGVPHFASTLQGRPLLDPVKSVVPAAQAEPVDDLEEVESLEEVEEIGVAEEIEEVESVEELEEVEPVEELEEIEEIGEAEEIEEVEEIGAAESEAAEAVDDLEEISEMGEAEVVAEIASAEYVEEQKETPSATVVEKINEIEDAEITDELAFVEEIEETEVVESLEPEEPKESKFDETVDSVALNGFEDVDDLFQLDSDTKFATKKSCHSPEEMFDLTENISNNFFALRYGKENTTTSNDIGELGEVALNFKTEIPFFGDSELDSPIQKLESREEKCVEENEPVSILSRTALGTPTSPEPIPQVQVYDKGMVSVDGIISQDSGGVFTIVNDIDVGGVVQDNSFKRLVDSVLSN